MWRAIIEALQRFFPKSTNGNPQAAIAEDLVGLAKSADIANLRDTLKPSRGTATQDLAAASVAAGGSQDVDKTGLDGWSAIYVIARITYDAAATAGARIVWMYSPDGTVYEDEDWAVTQGNYVDPPFTAGTTVTVGFLVPVFTPYVRIRIKNLDATYALTADMWTVPLR